MYKNRAKIIGKAPERRRYPSEHHANLKTLKNDFCLFKVTSFFEKFAYLCMLFWPPNGFFTSF